MMSVQHKYFDMQKSILTRFTHGIRGRFSAVLAWGKTCWYNPDYARVGQTLLAIGLMGFCLSALANGSDILQGTDASLWATLNGTGKKYIYASEGILGLAAYMKTKNLLVLSGIVVVSIFFNIILSIAGESA
jgi:hypothetical protein